MSEFVIPKNIINILSKIEKRGFEAYLVGGCVRDILMGRRPNDFDIASSAAPEDIMKIFKKTKGTGLRYGTVTVFYGKTKAEVTSFRSDGKYSDSRRPDRVRFVSGLREDLSRRDFTVNAMAMDKEGALTDIFDGRGDIERKMLRCVGTAEDRFSEDALRMLRAVRFSAQLGFEIGADEVRAIGKTALRAADLSAERVRDEILKTILSDRPEKAALFIEYGLIKKYVPYRATTDFTLLKRVKSEREHRLAGFAALFSKAGCESREILDKLRFSKAEAALCANAGCLAAREPSGDSVYVKDTLRTFGEETVKLALEVQQSIFGISDMKIYRKIKEGGECWSREGLMISPAELISCGITGKSIGIALDWLLKLVINNPELNEKDRLKELINNNFGGRQYE